MAAVACNLDQDFNLDLRITRVPVSRTRESHRDRPNIPPENIITATFGCSS
jgi:hypothetical protein